MGSSLAFRCRDCGSLDLTTIARLDRTPQSWGFVVGAGMAYSPERVFHGFPDEAPMLDSLVRSGKVKAEAHSRLHAGFVPEDDPAARMKVVRHRHPETEIA